MNLFRKTRDRIFPPVQPLAPGVYHYQAPATAEVPYRLHLRIDLDGQSVLIVNAKTVLHLNPTATEYAYHLVKQTPEDQAVAEIARRYNTRKEIVRRDYHDMLDRLQTLIHTQDLDPVSYLDFHRHEPYSGATTAPYRLDCALTYHLPDGIGHIAPQERVSRELAQEEWQTILDKAWEAGIPHVVFTGGEPTMRPDLNALIARAEKLGMVAGLITNGLRLSESKYLHNLLMSGLDHVMILLDPTEDQCWEAIRDTLQEDISLTVHITLTHQRLPRFEDDLKRLANMGVQKISLSAVSLDLKDALTEKQQHVAEHQLTLVWDMPVPYSQFNPVALELAGEDIETGAASAGAGQAWLYVEPDGDVLPGQGVYQHVLGNLLTEPWDAIWQNAEKFKSPAV